MKIIKNINYTPRDLYLSSIRIILFSIYFLLIFFHQTSIMQLQYPLFIKIKKNIQLSFMFYRNISLLAALIGISGAIFLFIEGRDDDAKIVLFFSIYTYFLMLYFLKSLYYRKHKATFNELFYVVGLPLIPLILSILGGVFKINGLRDFSDIFLLNVDLGSDLELVLTLSSVISLPFYIFSLYLLLRTFIRYKFIRFTPYSDGGIPATLLGIIISISIGFVYVLVSTIIGDFILLIFGLFYAITGILGFFA